MPTNTIDIIWNAATSVAPLGFVPVAIHFCLFDALVELDRPVKGQELLDAFPEKFCGRQTTAYDTLFAMTALSWVELVDGNRYKANDTTRHLARTPSALHGVLHFATEILFSSAFLMRKLQASDFEYPFAGLDTPMQFAYRAMGNDRLAQMHTYDIMAEEGRIASFNTFMQGKLGNERTMPERLTLLGYDLASVVEEARGQGQPVTMVDVGGGRGDMMLQVKEAIPGLEEKDLIVEECNPDITAIPGLSLVVWDYNAKNSPQPVEGALVYHLAGVFHNLPDLDAVRLLRKLSEAMAPYSRVLVHERRKAAVPGSHAAMVVLYGGRERSVEEWNELVELAGLQVTFYAFPDDRGLGVVEMRKKV
ncbi:uncharacterized protein BJX67DRAFT_373972 [Aspergillus lucknowensis]|uniref:O-methyltransferase C-terminal domain-containing protein n=1 Tax=Aspergillus lucknowensis TaxID=176173 RepID=A0ABR4LI76_9EURO